ncbi:hypothetical protein [Saccharomonospora sp. CUA-673]|uniref:hypothetical protein n=1 Tax=Saccharomonospora sp. CUA-673 TaxID=1904969 RepID=UPI000A452A3B|nr:hypothetical protein [Saccharomonospora sp. CUA-673]
MMIVRALWREASRFPTALAWSVVLAVLVFATYVAQAVAIAWAVSAVLSGQSADVLTALGVIIGIALARLVLSLAHTSAATRLGGRVREAVRRRAMHAALVPERLHDTTVRDGSMRATLGDGIDGTDATCRSTFPSSPRSRSAAHRWSSRRRCCRPGRACSWGSGSQVPWPAHWRGSG